MAGSISVPGIGSGIDSARLAQSLFDQLTLSNTVRSRQVQGISAENSSLEKLRTLLLDLSSKLDSLRSANGGFDTKSATSSNPLVVTAAADGNATSGSFTVNVSTLASTAKGSFSRQFTNVNDFIISDPGSAGNVQFVVGTGDDEASFSIAVDETTTASDFVSQFNAQSAGKASASLVNLGTNSAPSYVISFNSMEQGVDAGSISVGSDNPALSNISALGATTLEQASNATFTISGVSGAVERASNSINDLITGVSFQLEGVGEGVVTVADDSQVGSNQIKGFVGAYNSLVDYINKEDAVSVSQDGGNTSFIKGSLAESDVDENVLSSIRSIISSVSSSDSSVSLASMGISTERDGKLSFNEDKFNATFATNPSGVQQAVTALADGLSGTQGAIQGFAGFGKSIDLAIQANAETVSNLNETIGKTERSAQTRSDALLRQFTGLEALLAKLNSQSGYLTSLLRF